MRLYVIRTYAKTMNAYNSIVKCYIGYFRINIQSIISFWTHVVLADRKVIVWTQNFIVSAALQIFPRWPVIYTSNFSAVKRVSHEFEGSLFLFIKNAGSRLLDRL